MSEIVQPGNYEIGATLLSKAIQHVGSTMLGYGLIEVEPDVFSNYPQHSSNLAERLYWASNLGTPLIEIGTRLTTPMNTQLCRALGWQGARLIYDIMSSDALQHARGRRGTAIWYQRLGLLEPSRYMSDEPLDVHILPDVSTYLDEVEVTGCEIPDAARQSGATIYEAQDSNESLMADVLRMHIERFREAIPNSENTSQWAALDLASLQSLPSE